MIGKPRIVGKLLLLGVVVLGVVVLALYADASGGPSPSQQRDFLAAGVQAAHASIGRGECGLAERQLERAAADAGIDLD